MAPRRTLAAIIALGLVATACGPDDSKVAIELFPTADDRTSCPVDVTVTSQARPTGSTTPPSAPPAPPTSSVPTVSTTEPVADESTTSARPARALERGDTGEDVSAIQARLLELRFWLPSVSGEYDDATFHAVTAFEKATAREPDGRLTIEDQAALGAIELPPPVRSTEGHVIEVDIARQLVFVVHHGSPTWIFDTSTGARRGWTPTGTFAIEREIDGIRVSELGRLYRPKYVVGGVAIHGYPEVPPEPASHGCIRLTNDAMDAIWTLELAPIGTPVLIYDE